MFELQNLQRMNFGVQLLGLLVNTYFTYSESKSNSKIRSFEKIKNNIAEKRQSAARLVDRAQRAAQEGSFHASANYLEIAIKEWGIVSNANIQEQEIGKCMLADMWYLHGLMLYKDKKLDGAITSLLVSYESDPNSLMTVNTLGLIYYQKGDQVNAKKYFEISLGLNSQHPLAKMFICFIEEDYSELKMYLEDFFLYQQQNYVDEDFLPFVCYVYAKINMLDGKYYRAIEYASKGLEISAQKTYLNQLRSNLYFLRGNCFEAIGSNKPIFDPKLSPYRKVYVNSDKPDLTYVEDSFRDFDARTLKYFAQSFESLVTRLEKDQRSEIIETLAIHIESLLITGKFFLTPEDKEVKSLKQAYHEIYKHYNKALKRFNSLKEIMEDEKQLKEQEAVLNESRSKIRDFCIRPEVRKYFIENHLRSKGWKPWFNAVSDPSKRVLLDVLCEYEGLDLVVFVKPPSEENKLKRIRFKDNSSSRLNDDKHRLLHVCLQNKNGNYYFKIVHRVNNDSTLCKHFGLQDYWNAYRADPNNMVVHEKLLTDKVNMVKPKVHRAKMYEKGNGVTQSFKEAINLYRKAAELGNAEAKKSLENAFKQYYEDVREIAREIEGKNDPDIPYFLEALQYFSDEEVKGNPLAKNKVKEVAQAFIDGHSDDPATIIEFAEKCREYVFCAECYSATNTMHQSRINLAVLRLCNKDVQDKQVDIYAVLDEVLAEQTTCNSILKSSFSSLSDVIFYIQNYFQVNWKLTMNNHFYLAAETLSAFVRNYRAFKDNEDFSRLEQSVVKLNSLSDVNKSIIFEWQNEEVKHNKVSAYLFLAFVYEHGLFGQSKDIKRSLEWYEKVSEKNQYAKIKVEQLTNSFNRFSNSTSGVQIAAKTGVFSNNTPNVVPLDDLTDTLRKEN